MSYGQVLLFLLVITNSSWHSLVIELGINDEEEGECGWWQETSKSSSPSCVILGNPLSPLGTVGSCNDGIVIEFQP